MAVSPCHDNDATNQHLLADSQPCTRSWYFTKDEIDNNTPSRKDGIDRSTESSLRKLYCTFLKDLGMKLRLSPVTTATAMMFCHRFYMRQSHAKNDWQTIATACIFLACKVEDNLRLLRDVAMVAYEIIYKGDYSASERIKQREVYYKQKELILGAEHVLLVTMAFDICIQHPFRPLVDALKRLNISNNDVAKAAWNLVNEWLRTTLCLQYKPPYIAAASLSVAAKLLKFKLPVDKGKAWWMQFDVSPKTLEEVTQQMLRYFKDVGKSKVSQVPTKVLKGENVISQARQSSILSGLTGGSDPKKEAVAVDRRVRKLPSHKYSQNEMVKIHQLMVKETSGPRSSDCCSGISGVVDSESVQRSSKITHGDDALNNIDVNRLKGAFEKARQVKYAKHNIVTAAGEVDGDLIMEKELEEGIELEYATFTKKRKLVQD